MWGEIDFNVLYVFKQVPTYAFGMDLRSQMVIRQDSWDGFLDAGEYSTGVGNMEGSRELRGNVYELCVRELFDDEGSTAGPTMYRWPVWLDFAMCMESNFGVLGKALARSCSQWTNLPYEEIAKCASEHGPRLLRRAYKEWVHARKDLMGAAREGQEISTLKEVR
jgi:hypothetical protein